MKLTTALSIMAMCAALPAVVLGQTSSAAGVTTTVSRSPAPSATLPATSAPVSVSRAPASSAAPRPSQSVSTQGPLPPSSITCISSASCPVNQICAVANSTLTTSGTCRPLTTETLVCAAVPERPCDNHEKCTDPAFSFCALDEKSKRMMCTGLGVPGTASACTASSGGIAPPSTNNNNIVNNTLMYAGIAVGAVAVLGIIFALVRWQRRRQRSKVPANMFGDVDYGLSDRHSAPAAPKAEQSYPFSNRPHAHGSDRAPVQDYSYDDQYYEEPSGYNSNMHPMSGMAGGAKMQQDQYYGHDQYDPNYDQQYYGQSKDEYNAGYDNTQYGQQAQYGAQGGNDGFYDNAGYEDYNQHSAQGHVSPVPHTSPIAAPDAAARAVSPRQPYAPTGDYTVDRYGAEPSEIDFGGNSHGNNQAYGRY